MIITKIIAYTSLVLWLLPPFRQYRSRYFSFFLVLSLGDPFTMLLYSAGLLPAGGFHFFIISFFMFISYDNFKPLKEKKLNELILVLISIIPYFFTNNTNFGIIFLHLVIFMRFLRDAMVNTAKNYEVNLFYFALVLYELSIILKFFSIISTFYNYTYFYLTTVLEMLLALFFIFFREDKPKLSFSIQKDAA
jgi:hypothetical protein